VEHLVVHGAVSDQVAEAMAVGVARRAGAHWGVATTGIAGPGGGTHEKPVGLVHVAVHREMGDTEVSRHQLAGDRTQVQERACAAALGYLLRRLRS